MNDPTRTIGTYRVLSELGHGGMAEVLLVARARDPLEQRYALKRVLSKEAFKGDDDEYDNLLRAFREESLLSAKLQHPNIVRVFDVSTEVDRERFIVMEHVDGVHLGQILRHLRADGRLMPVNVALDTARLLCDALVYASEAFSVVHRDLTPSNILLGIHGELKLSDFGIALFRARDFRTATGVMKGKVAYMSPEQIDGNRTLDQRSDLFALGILLYEMLTNVHPFRPAKEHDAAVLRAIRYETSNFMPLDQRSTRSLDPMLLELVPQLLAQDPEDRPTDAGEVGEILEQLLTDGTATRIRANYVRETKKLVAERALPSTGSSEAGAAAPATTRTSTPPERFVAVRPIGELHPEVEDMLEESGELDLRHPVFANIEGQDVPNAIETPPAPAIATTRSSRPGRPSVASSAPKPRARMPLAAAVTVGLALLGLAVALMPRATPSVAAPLAAEPRPTPPKAAPSPARQDPPLAPPAPSAREVPSATSEAAAAAPTPPLGTTVPASTRVPKAEDTRPPRKGNATSSLRVIIEPWGHVWLDGKFLGLVDDINGLTPGRHVLQVGQHVPAKRQAVVLKPGNNTVNVHLQ